MTDMDASADETTDSGMAERRYSDLAQFTEAARREFRKHFTRLAGNQPIIHLGYCDQPNPGDNAISLAEGAILVSAGVNVRARISALDLELRYTEAEGYVRSVGQLPILFRGGGMLNDIYPPTSERHARIIDAFHDRPILESPRKAFPTHGSRRLTGLGVRSQATLTSAFLFEMTRAMSGRRGTSIARSRWCRTRCSPGSARLRRERAGGGIGVAARHDMEIGDRRGRVPDGPLIPWTDEPRAWIEPRLIPARIRRRFAGPSRTTSLLEPDCRSRSTRPCRPTVVVFRSCRGGPLAHRTYMHHEWNSCGGGRQFVRQDECSISNVAP